MDRLAQYRSIPARAGEPHPYLWPGPTSWVYPRACGGTSQRLSTTESILGLSPRVRGNRGPGLHLAQGCRSIPARAGEPVLITGGDDHQAVYPRACGGTANSRALADASAGLSPRVRGNPHHGRWQWRACGSIPARAGEPSEPGSPLVAQPVYPRACGGTLTRSTCCPMPAGLSPRVRGNLERDILVMPTMRSIPARAGEPYSQTDALGSGQVYPRACGGTCPQIMVGR